EKHYCPRDTANMIPLPFAPQPFALQAFTLLPFSSSPSGKGETVHVQYGFRCRRQPPVFPAVSDRQHAAAASAEGDGHQHGAMGGTGGTVPRGCDQRDVVQ